MKEFGGYFPLELKAGKELFERYPNAKVARFNSGRAAIAAAVLSVKPQKLYIPYYNCSVVREALASYGIPYIQYYLDKELKPKDVVLDTNEWIVYVNYFGTQSEEKINQIIQEYRNVIVDNTQAFYAKPVLDGNCMNAYSPRKFVGLVDGGYLLWSGDRAVNDNYPVDVSWDRAGFLFKSVELGTNAAYKDNLESKECFAHGIKRMSVLTQKMLRSIDYDDLARKRHRNYERIKALLGDINELRMPIEGFAPFIYPLLIERSGLREKVVEQKIYVPQWWKYLLDEVPEHSVEAWLSKWLLPIPIDHRYNEQDMEYLANTIRKICASL